MNRTLRINVGILAILAAVGAGYVHSSFADMVIVVNKTNPVTAVKKTVVGRYFLKKSTMWDFGIKVVPIDLPAAEPVREEFSKRILQSSPREVESHWISESLVGGKSAPEIVNNAALVKKRVAAEPGGIGYIDSAELDDSVKRVEVVD